MIVDDDVTEFGETETYRRPQGPDGTQHTHAWSDSCRSMSHDHPGGELPHRWADHAQAETSTLTEAWWPMTTTPGGNEHTHVLASGESYRHDHAGGAAAHVWADHTEDELAVGSVLTPDTEPGTDPLVEARAWLDERRLTPLPGSPAAEAIEHLDAVVGFVDDALASLVRGDVESALDLDEIPEPTTVTHRRVQLRVVYLDQTTLYFPIPERQGWRIDAGLRLLIVGRGLGREEIPLDRVAYFSPEEIRP